MLVEVAEAVMAQVATQSMLALTDDPTMVVDNEGAADGLKVGHVSKNTAGVGADGVLIGSPNRSDDHAKYTTEDPMGRIEMRRQTLTEASTMRYVNLSKSWRCRCKKDSRIKDEGVWKTTKRLKEEMAERIDLAVMEEEIKNLKIGSGSTVCSEISTGVGLGGSGTFARPPSIASRYHAILIPRKMEFKGWIADYTRGGLQGIANERVLKLIMDLEKMIPRQAHQWIDWDQTRKEQGNWRPKTMVSMW